jgi:TonB-dependent receptor
MPFLLGLILATATAASAQEGRLEGTISGEDSAFYLDGAVVRLANTAFRATTDRSGRFVIHNIPPGEYAVTVSYIGYATAARTLTIAAGGNLLDLTLASAEEDIVELDEFAVTAEASGTERALSKQKAADNRIDIISSDNFGQLPDSTIADAVRRLPGINVEKDAQGREGRYVTIRGMNADFNSVAVNGQSVVVSNFDGASRSVPLDVVSASNAESIEVTKSVLPSQDAAAIGGAINIRSRSAFDQRGESLALEASLGRNSLASRYRGDYPHDGLTREFFGRWSGRLNEEETLGVALSANVSQRPHLFRSVSNGPYVLDGDTYFPSYGMLEEAFDNIDTQGLAARLDFRPSGAFEASLSVDYSRRETNQGSQRGQVNFDPRFLVGELIESGDTAIGFTSEDRSQREVRDYYETQEKTTVAALFVHRFDTWELDYGIGYNMGEFAGDPKDTRAFFRTGFRDAGGSFLENSYALRGGDAYSPLYGTNHATLPPAEFALFEVRRDTRRIEDTTWSGYLNARKDLRWGELPGSIKVGFKYTRNDRDFDDLRRRYRTADTLWTLDSVVINGSEQVYGSVLADYGVDRALNGQAFGPMIDPAKVRAAEEALRTAGERDEGDPNWYLNQNVGRDARADLVNSYELDESVLAGYLEGRVNWEKTTLIAGFRVEATDTTIDTHAGDFFESRPDDPLFVRPVRGKNDYVNLFPHLHLRHDLTADWNLRASVNQTLARPSYRQLNPSTDIDPTAFDDRGLVLKGRTDLDPVVSTNLDFSVDRFFTGANRISFGVFYKSMSDNIYRLQREVRPEDPDYFPADAVVREFLNADGAQVWGLEFSFEYFLADLHASLRGWSVSGNYTWTDSTVDGIQRANADGSLFEESGRTPLFGQVPATVNLSVNYNHRGFDTRLAWNWSDAYLDFNGVNSDLRLDDYIDRRSRLDWSARYRFLDHWTVFAEIRNLLNDDARAYSGDRSTRMFYREESGRSAVIGLRWNR